jgi:hypothetical protein
MAQWFPIYESGEAPFLVDTTRSGALGAIATVTITLDNYPHLIYGVRFDVSYEIPAADFGALPGFKRDMREGGVDDDFDVTIQMTQQSIAAKRIHVRNLRGALGINQHPFPVPYPLRGSNKITLECRRNSSYPLFIVPDVRTLNILPTVKISLELARGVQSVADGQTSPPAPPSTGFPGRAGG